MEFGIENPIFLIFGTVSFVLAILAKWKLKNYSISYRYPLADYLFGNLSIKSSSKPIVIYFLRVASILSALGLASQFVTIEICKNVFVNSVDIVLAIDLSGSMDLYDDPKSDARSRFQVAKDVALDFVAKRTNDQIGVIGFAKDAITVSPVTLDKSMLTVAVGRLEIGQIDQNGTNISQALGLALARLKSSEAKSKIIVLLTDGNPNVNGDLTIERAISIAKECSIKIYTIGVGDSRGGYIKDPTFGFRQCQVDGVDLELLERIAKQTGAKSFQAMRPKDVEAAYQAIDKLETSKVKTNIWNNKTEWFFPFACTLVASLVLEQLLKLFWGGVW